MRAGAGARYHAAMASEDARARLRQAMALHSADDIDAALTAAREAIANLNGRDVERRLIGGDPITITVDGNEVTVDAEDLTLKKAFADHLAGASDGNTVVMIDKRLTPELKNEGLARDVVRNVQNLRKEAGLDIADRIALSLATESEPLRAAIEHGADYIKRETLAIHLNSDSPSDPLATSDVKIEGHTLAISLRKA